MLVLQLYTGIRLYTGAYYVVWKMTKTATSSFNLTFKLFLSTLLFVLGSIAVSAATVTLATGGGAISADDVGGGYTNLTGPSIVETVTSDIQQGTIVLLVPSGFEFDTGAPAVTVFLTSNENNANKNINDAANNSVLSITSNDGSEIAFTVVSKSNGQAKNTLTWQNVRVRPTAVSPLASGNITKMGTSIIDSVVNGTNLGTLTEVAGAPDTTIPVITLVGSTPLTVEVDSSYVDDGATALDNIDGDLTSSIVTVNPVDTSTLGNYTVTYDVSDAAGNDAVQVTRTVSVVDTTDPVISLVGSDPVSVEVNSVYSDDGATALDNYDGDLTSSIVVDSTVNTGVAGSYAVTYDVSDSSGNAATQVSRIVNVVDTTDPVITLLGSTPVNIEVGSVYVDDGATALDNYDGDLTSTILTVNPVDTSTVGAYIVTYDASDSSGNAAAQVTRTVNVVDTTDPIISLVGSTPVIIEVGSVYVDDGATALDNYDGDLTGSIVTVNPVDTSAVGVYVVTYDASDSSGNAAAQVTRTVNVVDTGIPVITLTGSDTVSVEVGSVYVDDGATALDSGDGDLTSSIVTVNPVDTSTLGAYIVTYDVSDSSGNNATQVSRTVNVVDTTDPVISLVGSDPVSVEIGSVYSDDGATALDNYDGDLTGSISTVNPVDASTLGAYIVTYDVSDSSGNSAAQVTRTVNVVDTGIPVITLTGSDPVSVEVGSVYVDDGATALDSGDGDLTGSIVVDSTVNTSVVGSYVVTYDVSDSSSNAAVQVSRTVNVVDTTDPVISLVGSDPVSVEIGSVYSDDGATALDNYDGDLTSTILTVNPVDTSILGAYIVTYDASDSSGNAAAQVTRTVNVVDTGVPVITLLGTDPVYVEVGLWVGYSDAGATALDDVDGDISGSVLIDTNDVGASIIGTYTVYFNVNDSSGNPAVEVTRTVIVQDTTAPVITLLGSSPIDVEAGTVYVDDGAIAIDDFDNVDVAHNYSGDISGSIIAVSDVDTSALGAYSVVYDVNDSSGNPAITVTRTVNVVDTTPPVITILGANPASITVGSSYADAGATASDNLDGNVTAFIVATNGVNASAIGSYNVTYDITDSSGNSAQAVRTVDVVAAPAPASGGGSGGGGVSGRNVRMLQAQSQQNKTEPVVYVSWPEPNFGDGPAPVPEVVEEPLPEFIPEQVSSFTGGEITGAVAGAPGSPHWLWWILLLILIALAIIGIWYSRRKK